jgi:hypothetical protein
MGNFVSLSIDVATNPTDFLKRGETPSPTEQVASGIQEILSDISEEERIDLLDKDFDLEVSLPTTSVSNELENVYEDKAQDFDLEVPLPTTSVSNELENVYEDKAQDFDLEVPFPTTSVSNELYNIETFVGDNSYLKNTRTNKMSQGIFNRNTDSVILGPNTFSK